MSVAIVMPEIGFEELPTSPVMRDDTVTKKKPKTTMRTADRTLPCVGVPGVTTRKIASSSEPTSTTLIGRSRSVRTRPIWPAPAPKSFMLSRNDVMMVGVVRASVISPDASTAPGAGVADIGAPQLPGAHLVDAAGRWPGDALRRRAAPS